MRAADLRLFGVARYVRRTIGVRPLESIGRLGSDKRTPLFLLGVSGGVKTPGGTSDLIAVRAQHRWLRRNAIGRSRSSISGNVRCNGFLLFLLQENLDSFE